MRIDVKEFCKTFNVEHATNQCNSGVELLDIVMGEVLEERYLGFTSEGIDVPVSREEADGRDEVSCYLRKIEQNGTTVFAFLEDGMDYDWEENLTFFDSFEEAKDYYDNWSSSRNLSFTLEEQAEVLNTELREKGEEDLEVKVRNRKIQLWYGSHLLWGNMNSKFKYIDDFSYHIN